jgi:hypothetical protein
MASAMERMRPGLFRRFLPYDRRQKLLAWGTPLLFFASTITIIFVNDPSLFRGKSLQRDLLNDTPPPPPPVDWKALPWRASSADRAQLPAGKAIRIHGEPSQTVSQLYNTPIAGFFPRWLTLPGAFLSPSGHVVHQGQTYPPDDPQFPPFDRTSLDSLATDNISLGKVIALQAPPGMPAVDAILGMLPLMFTKPEKPSIANRYVVARQFVDPSRLFNASRLTFFNLTVLHDRWGVAEEISFPEIPTYTQIPIAGLAKMKTKFSDAYIMAGGLPGKCLMVPHNSRAFPVASILARLRQRGIAIIEQEAFPDPLIAFEAMCQVDCAIGFENKNLGFAAFMKPGSLIVEIQRPGYTSRAALLAAAMGMATHVFVSSPEAVDVDALAAVLNVKKRYTE